MTDTPVLHSPTPIQTSSTTSTPLAMVFKPGVSFFVSYHELDPSVDQRCIFYTQKGTRCRNFCGPSDNRRAMELHGAIEVLNNAVDIDVVKDYVLSRCCTRAKHQDRIEDVGLLFPLAQRWLDEILSYARSLKSFPALEESIVTTDARNTLPTPRSDEPMTVSGPNLSNHRPRSPKSNCINAPLSTPISSSPSFQHALLESSPAAPLKCHPRPNQSRYGLRSRETVNSSPSRTVLTTRSPLSEFRAHVANPSRNDSVFSKILAPLERRDLETGSLYIFDRASSPGHVKIGWTARSVSGRLESWSKCGYRPNLLFSVNCTPNAQRVETLTHHELIKEWRRERMCKAPHCGKSHQEWFEISRERAEEVLTSWAVFMKRAQPYDASGRLKSQWRDVVQMIDKTGEVVTGKRLLEWYENSLVKVVTAAREALPILESKDIKPEVKVVEICIEDETESEKLVGVENTSIHVDSLLIDESTVVKVEPPSKDNSPHRELQPGRGISATRMPLNS